MIKFNEPETTGGKKLTSSNSQDALHHWGTQDRNLETGTGAEANIKEHYLLACSSLCAQFVLVQFETSYPRLAFSTARAQKMFRLLFHGLQSLAFPQGSVHSMWLPGHIICRAPKVSELTCRTLLAELAQQGWSSGHMWVTLICSDHTELQ